MHPSDDEQAVPRTDGDRSQHPDRAGFSIPTRGM